MESISVKSVGKAYRYYPTRFSRLKEWLIPDKPKHTEKWILRDINFNIDAGDAVGIIGVNGAGKSTLLKMIAGTTLPTTGTITISGRVAALLELGMGFHPDFTGRQNAYMSGQLLGYTEEEMNSIIPEIEAFANIGEYFDKPVRTYSSGMQARVGFSVATAIKPDILIVDEALSVGDIAFQAKCMQRMESLLKAKTTILFVSHAMAQVRQFCNKAIYIADGALKAFGPVDEVCDLYQNSLADKYITENIRKTSSNAARESASFERDITLRENSVLDDAGTLELEFLRFDILNTNEDRIAACFAKESIIFRAVICANHSVPEGTSVGLLIGDKTGYPLLSCNSNYYDKFLPALNKGDIVVIKWKLILPFYSGEYRIDIGMKPDILSNKFYDRVFCAKVLTVNTPVELLKRNFGGILYAESVIEVIKK